MVARATIWGLAIVFVHYCSEYRNLYHQSLLTVIEGIWAATFYTKEPASSEARYPEFVLFTILAIVVSVCGMSNTVLAYDAIVSRTRTAILTKRQLRSIIADKEAVEEADELKQEFISIASHEIRTPLHAVNGFCELLAMTDLTEEQTVYLSRMQQACHAIHVIAGNVLDFSKLDRNNIELSARPVLVDLRKMLEDQVQIIETTGAAHPPPGIDVIISVLNNVPSSLYLDAIYIFRIIMNLLSNAEKFCTDGYICIVVAMDSESQVELKISDTGCGIPESFRGGLFEPYQQADSSLTRPRQGTGLGLSIVKQLVQSMSGTVDVESVEGEGMIYRQQRTARLFADLWGQYGLTASLAAPDVSFADLVEDADIIWADIETVSQSDALKHLMSVDLSIKLPTLFIVYSDALELAILQPALSSSRRVVLVKRPVVMHSILEMLRNPEAYTNAHIAPGQVKGSFALPRPHENKFLSAEPLPNGGHTILLVEDNMSWTGLQRL
ncbi:hypothetical protein EW026_g7003 [Hermanssonia centrifuga]|uniref:histidine kinase n=1 Tax=Hermanssonia centrifuga TaxID=98765 RepID=A0A4S4KAY8_9APHY|nr:hypothetical protein EW026_g7003 [Hermanssonia centrifuga]